MTRLAIDIGGSGSRARLSGASVVDLEGPALAVEAGRPDYELVLEAVGAALPAGTGPSTVVIGAAGILSLGVPAELASTAQRLWPEALVAVVPDVVAGLVGAWGLDGGIIIAAGTGSIGLASDLEDVWQRSDGWGHLLGDNGSGAWIGARGIEAALRQHDGRAGGSVPLLDALRTTLGEPSGLPALVRSAHNEAGLLASFVPDVVAVARSGDGVAAGILDDAGRQLAETASSLFIDRVPCRVALVGGIARIGEVVTRFEHGLREARPDADIVIGGSEAIDGAARLAEHVADGRLERARPPYITVFPTRASRA